MTRNGKSRTDKKCKISSLEELSCGLEMIEKRNAWRLEDRAIKNIKSEEVKQSGWNLGELERFASLAYVLEVLEGKREQKSS